MAKTDAELWDILVRDWQTVRDKANKAQAAVTGAMAACYRANGPNPTMDQLDTADQLWEHERTLRKAMEKFIKERFG